jgi:PAS domain S-box-containing protein
MEVSMSESTRILVIDNDPIFAETLRLALQKRFRAEVVIAEDCTSARNILSSSSFDLITLDYLLPESTGVDFLEEIKPALGFTQVVMVTGKGDENTAAQAYRAGAVGYIIKDRDFSVMLLSILERAIEQSRMEKSLRDSEVRYRRLFEAARDGILIMDADTGLVIDVNPFLEDLLGYSREEMVGKNPSDIGAFKEIPESEALFSELREKGYLRREHLLLKSKDDCQIDVEFVGNAYLADRTRLIQCNLRDLA